MNRKRRTRYALIALVFLLLLESRVIYADLTDGLVAYWPFDEGSGSTAFDAAGLEERRESWKVKRNREC